MKIKFNDDVELINYASREEWVSVIQELFGRLVVADLRDRNSRREPFDISIFKENDFVNPEDKLPINILTISLMDSWGLQYRTQLGAFEYYPDYLKEDDLIQLIDLYCTDFNGFQSKFQWVPTSKFGYGLSKVQKIIFGSIAAIISLGIIVFLLLKNGLINFR